jgi:hypothetical protein
MQEGENTRGKLARAIGRLGIYLVRPLLSSRINHTFARLQSRITVSGGTFSTLAVSWTV